jgi:hypothetical protein
VEREVTNQVTVGEKTKTKASIPTIGNQLQQPVNQHMLHTHSSAKYHCGYCNKYNHTEDRCFKKKKGLEEKNSGREMALCIYETALIAHEKSDGLLQSYTFIA